MTRRCPPSIFAEDELNRKPFADILTGLIKEGEPTTNENSFVMALNSPWGSGKTCFIDMWMNQMKEDGEKFNIIKYNAWENDDASDPMLPIICSFSQLSENCTDGKLKMEYREKALSILKIVLSGALRIAVDKVAGPEGVRVAEEIQRTVTDHPEDVIYNKYIKLDQEKEAFKKLIRSFVPDDGKLLIFIDELDRCRPTYAIETLEVVKHFFDIDGVVFVFSVDIKQLSHSIKNIYGDIDSVGYLQRFFDRQIFLPRPNLRDLLKKNLTAEIDGNPFFLSDIASIISELTTIFSFSLRDVEIICSNLRKFYDDKAKISLAIHPYKSSDRYKEFRAVYALLFALKYGQPLLYVDIINNGVDQENEIVKKLLKIESTGIDTFLTYYRNDPSTSSYIPELRLDCIINPNFKPTCDKEIMEKVAFNLIYWDDFGNDYRNIPHQYQSLKLSDAVRNNVESSCMY